MNSPELELRDIILQLTENKDPKSHKAHVDKYFTKDCSFYHPLATVQSGPHSREQLKNVYTVYKVFAKDIKINIQKITVDSNCTRAVVELEEDLTPTFFPIFRVR